MASCFQCAIARIQIINIRLSENYSAAVTSPDAESLHKGAGQELLDAKPRQSSGHDKTIPE